MLEDTKEYISYAPKNEIKAQDRRPFDLLVCSLLVRILIIFQLYRTCFKLTSIFVLGLIQVIINPKLKKKGSKTALFFEGCLR